MSLLDDLNHYNRTKKALKTQKEKLKDCIYLELISSPRVWQQLELDGGKKFPFLCPSLPCIFVKTKEVFLEEDRYHMTYVLYGSIGEYTLKITEILKMVSVSFSTKQFDLTLYEFGFIPSDKHNITVEVNDVTDPKAPFHYRQMAPKTIVPTKTLLKDFYPTILDVDFHTHILSYNSGSEEGYHSKIKSYFFNTMIPSVPDLRALCESYQKRQEISPIVFDGNSICFSLNKLIADKLPFEGKDIFYFRARLLKHDIFQISITLSANGISPKSFECTYLCDSNLSISISNIPISSLALPKPNDK